MAKNGSKPRKQIETTQDDGITIDKEFRALFRGLTTSETERLEAALIADGCREPLDVWASPDGAILLDGHNRRALCIAHDIPYKVSRLKFASRSDALNWVLQKQLGKRNLTEQEYSFLRGKQYTADKQDHGGDRKSLRRRSSGQNVHLKKTSTQLAGAAGVNEKTVRRDAEFAAHIDAIADVAPAVKDAILSGELKSTRATVEELAELDKPALRKAAKLIAAGEVATAKEAIAAVAPKPAADPPKKDDAPTDKVGDVIPPRVRPAFEVLAVFAEAGKLQSRFCELVEQIKDSPAGCFLAHQALTTAAKNLASELKHSRPYAVCPACEGRGCASCRKGGWVTKVIFDQPR